MSYQRVNWRTGTKVSDGYVEIDGTRHPVTPATYSGPTPCNPTSLNIMDVGIEENSNNIDKINNKLNGQASINELYVGDIKHKNFWAFPNEKRITTRESFSMDIPAGTYTISGEITGDDAIDSLIQFYDDNDNLVNSVLLEHNISTHQTFQLSNDCKIVRVYSNDSYESSLNKIAIFENMQLEPGDTVTDYFERKNIIPIIENDLGSDSTVNGASIHVVKENLNLKQNKGNELWVNANVVSSFGTQDIVLDLSNYLFVEIIYRMYPSSDEREMISKYYVGSKGELDYHDYDASTVRSWIRYVNVKTNKIEFNSCYINGQEDNSGLVPYKIIGYK